MLDLQRRVPERRSDPRLLALEAARPLVVVVADLDRPFQWSQLADDDRPELLLDVAFGHASTIARNAVRAAGLCRAAEARDAGVPARAARAGAQRGGLRRVVVVEGPHPRDA